jgi:uncharacterized protein
LPPAPAAHESALSEALRRRASIGEVILVLGLPTGFFLASSLAWLARKEGAIPFDDGRLFETLAIEAAIALPLLPFLWRRGWSPFKIGGAPEWQDVIRGLGVWLTYMGAFYIAFLILSAVAPTLAESLRQPQFAGVVSPSAAIAGALLNPLFEEFLWLGYAIPAIGSRLGLRVACAVSVALRVSVHLYQGPLLAFVAILPLSFVVTWYFARTGRIWPVIVAHVITDAIGLGSLTIPA